MSVALRARERRIAAAAMLLPAVGVSAQAPTSMPAPTASTSSLPNNLPLKRDETSPGEGSFWITGVFLVLLLVVAGLAVARRKEPGFLMRALGARGGIGTLDRIASQPLTPHATLHAVRWHDEELLLGCTLQQVTVLARRPAPSSTEVA